MMTVTCRDTQTDGFTLTEVLVALVVMAVGMLGIAALYVEGLRAGRTSVYRVTAVTLAADMADRIRANPSAGASYAGTGPGSDNGCVNGGTCNAMEMAQDDWYRWLQDVHSRLPEGTTASITVTDIAPLVQYDITLNWPESGQQAPVSYTLAMQL